MPLEKKPKMASGYSAEHTETCERVLVTLLSAFNTLKSTVRLVGGLVPRYLTPESPPDVPAHAGTSDVDVVLNLKLIAEGEGYHALAQQLEERGFKRYVEDNNWSSGWRWMYPITETHYVLVEFLRGAKDKSPGDAFAIDGEKVAALAVKHAEITHEWFAETRVTAMTLNGGGIAVEDVRHANLTSFIILKALAFDGRAEPKDAGDLIHVLRYAHDGNLGAVASEFIAAAKSGLHPEAINDGLDALQRKFAEGNGVEGYLLDGPVRYAQFHHGVDDADSEDHILAQRFATGLVTEFLRLVHEGIA